MEKSSSACTPRPSTGRTSTRSTRGALDLVQGVAVGPLTAILGRRRAGLMMWWKPFNAADAKTLTDLVQAGHITPAIDRRYPLSEAVEALRWVDEGRAKGKVLIVVVDSSGGDGSTSRSRP